MICPHCSGANADDAVTCAGCGAPLTSVQPVDKELEREREFSAWLDAATPGMFVTTILVVVNVLVFIAMTARGASPIEPATDALIKWGANYGPRTARAGEWWRLLTSAFVHIGILHLGMNMIVLWTSGRLAEQLFGRAGFVVLYGLSALAGSLASVAFHPMIPSAGASGAVFGIYGGFIGFLIVCRTSLPQEVRSSMWHNTIGFVVYNIAFGLTQRHVDMAAHLGGLVAGTIAGAALAIPFAPHFHRIRLQRAAVVAVAGIALLAISARRVPAFDDWAAAVERWSEVEGSVERRLGESIRQVDKKEITREQFADRIEQELVPAVEEQRTKIAALHLPPADKTRADKFTTYLTLRVDVLRLTAAAERANDPALMREADLKYEKALVAMLDIAPSERIKAELALRSEFRKRRQSFAAEVERVEQLDRGSAALYNRMVGAARRGSYSPPDLALKVQREIVEPWQAAQQQLADATFAPDQQIVRDRLVQYVGLRTEGWKLIAAGIKNNDPKAMADAAAKHAEAAKLLQPPAANGGR